MNNSWAKEIHRPPVAGSLDVLVYQHQGRVSMQNNQVECHSV